MSVRGGAVVAPLLVAAVTVALGLPALAWPADTLDEMILLVYPLRMLEGAFPYEDFFAAYGPAHWWVLELLYAFTSPTVLVMRLLGLVLHAALALAVYALVLPSGRRQAVLSGLTAGLVLFPLGAAPYAWVTSAALCLGALACLRADQLSLRRAACAGLLCGLAVAVRPDTLLLAVLPALALLRGSGRWRAWSTGLLLGLSPLLVGLALAPTTLVQNVILGRAGRAAGQSRLPLPPASAEDRALLAVLLAAVLVAVLAAVLTRNRLHLSLALLAVLSLPQALQRVDSVHLLYAGLLVFPVLPIVVSDLHDRSPLRLGRTALGLAAFALAVVATAGSILKPLVLTLAGRGPSAVAVEHHGRTIPEQPARAAALDRLLPVLDGLTPQGATLFVYDSDLVRPLLTDVGLYYLMPQLRSDAYTLEITPGLSSAAGSPLADDLRRADVVVLVTAPSAFRSALFPYARDGSEEAADVLEEEFCEVAAVEYYRVYARCGSGG